MKQQVDEREEKVNNSGGIDRIEAEGLACDAREASRIRPRKSNDFVKC